MRNQIVFVFLKLESVSLHISDHNWGYFSAVLENSRLLKQLIDKVDRVERLIGQTENVSLFELLNEHVIINDKRLLALACCRDGRFGSKKVIGFRVGNLRVNADGDYLITVLLRQRLKQFWAILRVQTHINCFIFGVFFDKLTHDRVSYGSFPNARHSFKQNKIAFGHGSPKIKPHVTTC